MVWKDCIFSRGSPDTVNEENASIATIQAVMISLNSNTGEAWNRIYSITSFFMGVADDLIPYDYIKAINDLFGKDFNVEILKKKDQLNKLRERLMETNNSAASPAGWMLWPFWALMMLLPFLRMKKMQIM